MSRVYDNVIDVGLTTRYRVNGLPDGTYYFAVTAYDTGGFQSGFSDEVSTALTTPPPIIAAVAASGLTFGSATISWTTDTPSDSQVQYGISASYSGSTELDTRIVTSHSATLSGLTAGTVYYYRVKSRDAARNLASSPDFAFTTTTVPRPLSSTSSIIDFNGDGYADAFLYNSSTVLGRQCWAMVATGSLLLRKALFRRG